jgi:hypothetical protein
MSFLHHKIEFMDPADSENKEVLGKIALFASVVVLSCLASCARMLNDNKDQPITVKVLLTYLAGGVTAGIIIALLAYRFYGPSYFLIGLSGVAGFGSVQILSMLTILVEVLARKVGRFIGVSKPPNDDEPS